MKKYSLIWTALAVLTVLLSACRPATPVTPSVTPVDANAVFTAAASTANARMTELAAVTPTQALATATNTAEPSATTAPTTAVTTPAVPVATTSVPASSGNDNSEYVSDVTVPDDTRFQAGESFTKTWQVKNIGTSTWTTAYKLMYIDGTQMTTSTSVAVPSQVAPNATVNISVPMTAPTSAGTYTGYWQMSNAAGQLFGTPIYVRIIVGAGTAAASGTPATATATVTPGGPTNTPGAATATQTPSGSMVSNVTLTVDQDFVTGGCPHTFNFTSQFSLDRPATVTYNLEAQTGIPLTLPSPVTASLGQGTHQLTYTLDFTSSVEGWARFNVTAPNNASSNQVTFKLTCQ